jgi:serine/threonine protein kinase
VRPVAVATRDDSRATEPLVDLVPVSEHRPATPSRHAVHRKASLPLPADRRAHVAPDVLGDLLPGVETTISFGVIGRFVHGGLAGRRILPCPVRSCHLARSIGLRDSACATAAHSLDRLLDETVALKLLRADLATDAGAVRRFRTEIKLARKVTHPNVCRIHDFGESDGLLYISMEFVDGDITVVAIRAENRMGLRTRIDRTVVKAGR